MKIDRNESCICGSGKKNKACCNKEKISDAEFEELVMKVAHQSLEQNEDKLLKSIACLELYLSYNNISDNSKVNVLSNLIGAYQRRGLHTKALVLLKQLRELSKINDRIGNIFTTCYEAVSLSALQQYEEAVNKIDSIIDILIEEAFSSTGIGMFLLDAGKIYIYGERLKSAKKCLEKCIQVFKDNPKEQEIVEKAKANIAFILMRDEDEEMSKKGLNLLEKSNEKKLALGDFIGLSINYSNLGRYYLSKKNYKSALAYLRKDLWISRQVGDLHAVEVSLRNMCNIYIELRQYKDAKRMISESRSIGEKLSEDLIIQIAAKHLKLIQELSRQAAEDHIPIGPKTMCVCGENKYYQDCCGIADHDPIELPFRIAGSSEYLDSEKYQFARNIKRRKLDFIFKDSDHSSRRRSWNTFEFKNGWYEMYELPDMSNHYLLAAKDLLRDLPDNSESTETPLTCLIMSVCALEAFINQVIYFFYEERNTSVESVTPSQSAFSMNAFDFQKSIELTNKWDILGKEICKETWEPGEQRWNNFKNLVYVRNEFIHFKFTAYERVIPPPRTPHSIFAKLPNTVKLREVYHSWPIKILTTSFARWSVEVAEDMIRYFKVQYNKKYEEL